MYYISIGFSHPRIGTELGDKINDFYPVGTSQADTLIHINLLDELTDIKSNNNLNHLYEDFLKMRAIDSTSSNKNLKNIRNIFDAFKMHYTRKNKNAIKFYLLKVEDKQVKDVIKYWKTYREKV